MCNFRTLTTSENGNIIQCSQCNHIQVAFGTTIMSYTRTEFYEHISVVDDQYRLYKDAAHRDRKIVHVPSPGRGMAMIYTVRELCVLRYLLSEARKKLEFDELYVFSKN